MKSIFVIVSLLFVSLQSYANEHYYFAGNYNPIGGGKCGIHLEVSGNMVVATNIVPPNQEGESFCRSISSGCEGSSFSLNCDAEGSCFSRQQDLVLSLMSDGNIFFHNSGTKFVRTYKTGYQWCVYK